MVGMVNNVDRTAKVEQCASFKFRCKRSMNWFDFFKIPHPKKTKFPQMIIDHEHRTYTT